MTEPLLAVEGLAKSFGGVAAVHDVSFRLARSEMLALIGPNGAGKSTLFNLVNGQLRPDRGAVRLDGRDVTGLSPERMWASGVGRTFQVAEPFRSMGVRESVAVALGAGAGDLRRPWGGGSARHRAEADRLLEGLGLLARADDPAGHLAYGDAKRLDLALALANRPALLLMDEPTAGMAPAERRDVMRLVAIIARRDGVGVLFTEHDTDAVFGHADRVLVLDRGALVAEGPPAAVRANPRVRAVYLGTAALPFPSLSGRSSAGGVEGGGQAGEGATVAPPSSRPPPPPGGLRPDRKGEGSDSAVPALVVEGLDAFYGAAQVLFGVSFAVKPGEVVALVGRNGAGKSTTLKALVGLGPERRGRVLVSGQDVVRFPTHRVARLGLGFVPEERRIFADLTVAENLEAGRRPPRPGAEPWTPERLFALFPNLAVMRGRPAGRMSGGEQQMLAIARTLMGNPRLLLLDEPSEGLAPLIVDGLADAVAALKREGLAILLCEQNLRFAHAVLDRAYAIERGEIRAEATGAELARDPALLDRYLAA